MSAVPDVSVVIPTHDRWHLLHRHALPSALSQRGVDVEVIVVDNGSTDGTFDRLTALRDPRVVPLRQEEPGTAAARNAGIRLARGRWIAFLDDDDLWSPDKLRLQLERADDTQWCYAGVAVVDESLSVKELLPVPDPVAIAELLRHGSAVPGGPSNVVVRTELLHGVGGFDEALQHPADWDLWLRLARAAVPAAVDEIVVATLDHGGRSFFREGRDIRAEIEVVLARAGGDEADRQAVDEWFANQLYRGGHRGRAAREYLATAIRYRSPGNVPPALGALFGDRGMRAASAVLERIGSGSHLDVSPIPPATEPAWLAAFRGAP
jgi:glycosyltransferase involved in cell wall biosynthesis